MAYNYVVSARKPTAVLALQRARFTGPNDDNLIIVKSTRLEIHRVSEEGLELVLDEPLNAELQIVQVIRHAAHEQDQLFVVTKLKQYCILSYSPEHQCLMTRQSGSVRDRIGKDVEGGPIGVADPEGRLIGLHLCEGLLKLLTIDKSGRVSKMDDCRLSEAKVLDLAFLHGYPKPTVALLGEDPTWERRYLVTQGIDGNTAQMSSGPFEVKSLPTTASMLIAVPPPLYGLLIVAGDVILYRSRSSTSLVQVQIPLTSMQASTVMEDPDIDPATRGIRILLSDCLGKVYLLLLQPDPSADAGVALSFDLLGETSGAYSLAYLGRGIAFLGSYSADSKIVRFRTPEEASGSGNSGNSRIEVLDVYENLGPITDMCVVDLDRQGQGQIVTCSGTSRDGSLRVVRNGIGIAAQSSLDLVGVQGLFALRAGDDSMFDEVLVLSFLNETRCLRIDGEMMSEAAIPSFTEAAIRTLYAGNVCGNRWIHVTPAVVEVIADGGAHVSDSWSSPEGLRITVAAGYSEGVVVSLEGGEVMHLEVGDEGKLVGRGHLTLQHEVSCIGIGVIPEDGEDVMDVEDGHGGGGRRVVALGTWDEFCVRILSLERFEEVHAEHIGGDVQARSILISRLGSVVHLLVALGDGQLFSWTLARTSSEGDAGLTLRPGKRLRLGVQPLDLRLFRAGNGEVAVFAACDKPCVLSGDDTRLLCANVNSGEVQVMCPFHAESFPNCIALATEDGFTIGTIDNVQRLHVQTVPMHSEPRKIAHARGHRCFCVAAERHESIEEYGMFQEVQLASLHFLDDVTFEELMLTPKMDLDQSESVMAMASMPLSIDGNDVELFVVGTGHEDEECIEPEHGRILVFVLTGVGQDRRAELKCEFGVRGCVYSLQEFQGKIICGVNSEVHIYTFEKVDGLEGEFDLRRECFYRTHMLVVDIDHHGEFIAAGDLIRSVTMLRYVPNAEPGMPGHLEESAHDYAASWITQVHMLDEEYCIAAENSNNLFTLRRDVEATTDEEKSRLQLKGEYHVGEFVNKLVAGSLVMRGADGGRTPASEVTTEAATSESKMELQAEKPELGAAKASGTKEPRPRLSTDTQVLHSVLFGTVSGAIGVILGLKKEDYDFFRTLQNCVAEVMNHVGGFSHGKYREYTSTHHCGGNNGFIDGDLVERFLELQQVDKERVTKSLRASSFYKDILTAKWESEAGSGIPDVDVTFVTRKVQEIIRYH